MKHQTIKRTVLTILAFSAFLACACADAGCSNPSPLDDMPTSGSAMPKAGIRTASGISPQGGTITGATTGGGLIVTVGKLGLDSTACSTGDVKKWNGSLWVCGVGGITNAAGANVIPKSNGTNLVASLLTDSVTTLAYNTNKFTVDSATGNTLIAGTLGITGVTTVTGGITGLPATSCSAGSMLTALGTTGTGTCTSITTVGGITGTGTIGRSLRWTGAKTAGDGAWTDDGTNATIGGTFGVTGLATLTGGFTLGTDSSAASHKITNLTNGSSAQDAAAFGQIATGVSGAVSGTANRVAKFTGTNVVGNTNITDDGTNISIGLAATNVNTLRGNTTIGEASGTGDAQQINGQVTFHCPSGDTIINYGLADSYYRACTASGTVYIGDSGTSGSVQIGNATAPTNVLGNLTVAGNTTLGDAASDSITFKNGPSGENLEQGQHFEWTDEFMWTAAPSGTWAPSPMGLSYVVSQGSSGTGAAIVEYSSTDIAAGRDDRMGEVALKTGTSTTGGYIALLGGKAFGLVNSKLLTFELSSKWDALSTSSTATPGDYASVWGLTDAPASAPTGNVVNGCYFAYDKSNQLTGSINAGNVDAVECWCAIGGVRTGYLINNTGNSDNAFPLGVGTVVAQTYYRYKIVASSSKAEFYRATANTYVKVCEINTHMPTGVALGVSFEMLPLNGAGTGGADREFILDQARMMVDLNAVRSP